MIVSVSDAVLSIGSPVNFQPKERWTSLAVTSNQQCWVNLSRLTSKKLPANERPSYDR